MQYNPDSRKKILAGIVAGAVILGSAAGYYYSQRAKPAASDAAGHAGHQMTSGAGGTAAMTGEKVTLDARARQLAGVQTAPAVRKQLVREIRTTGKVALNESRRSFITSRVEGRVDELYVTAEGAYMAPGQAIASVYSPTYIAAQEEYILAFDGVKKLQGAGADVVQMNNRLLDAAKRKLLLIGVPAGEIEHLGHMHKANTHMTVRAQFGGSVMDKLVLPGSYIMPGDKLYNLADLSNVWMFADIYEKDIAAISLGQSVSVTSPAYPGESFGGEVQFINPVLDDATRTVKVRVSMANPDGKLKPNLFVNASIQLPLADSLVIPASSLLDTGLRRVVFVATAEDTFVKRDVVTGQEADGYVQVLSGISQGETVVTSATFLIDSQTQLGQYGSHAGHGGAKAGGAVPAAGPQTQKAAPGNSMPDMPGMPATPAAPAAPAGPAPNPHAGH